MNCLQASRDLPWPARSLHLSPIEHVWDVMKRRLQLFRNVVDLARQFGKKFRKTPSETLSFYAMPSDNLHPGRRWSNALLISSLCNDETLE